jgi:hypothetical protein
LQVANGFSFTENENTSEEARHGKKMSDAEV